MAPSKFDFRQLPVPSLMGIVNVTPDSFSDGGTFFDAHAAAHHARQLAHDGAAILDLGAEATSFFRPGIHPVPAEVQLQRLLPVLELLHDPKVPALLSVDTRSAQVARRVLRAGARIINDVSAGTHDPEILQVVAQHNAGIILMHISPAFPATPTADDPDILATVRHYLADRVQAALSAGITPEQIAIDPGIGFGKSMPDNWRLALRTTEIQPPGFTLPIVLGASRKRFLETPVPPDLHWPAHWQAWIAAQQPHAPHPRDPLSAALTAQALHHHIPLHRLHNASLAQQAIKSLDIQA